MTSLTNQKKKTGAKGSIKLKCHFPLKDGGKGGNDTGRNTKKIEDCYKIGEELGRGGFSIVKKGLNKTTNDPVAIKIIEKKKHQEMKNFNFCTERLIS